MAAGMSNSNNPFDIATSHSDRAKQEKARGKKPLSVPKRSPEDIELARRLLEKVQQMPDVREELCAKVRQEIEQGTYETPERLERAVDRLLEEVFEEDQQPPITGEFRLRRR